jgi:hypothetical protein
MVRFLVVLTIMLIALGSLMKRRTGVETMNWNGQVPAGAWVHVSNLNGAVTVEGTSGSTVEVHAVERWRGSKHFARMEVKQLGADTYICGLYGGNDRCGKPGARHADRHHGWNPFRRRADANITFTSRVPQGVKVEANTVNGSVNIRDAGGEVLANTVNGSVKTSTSVGPVRIRTVNGSIHASIDSLPSGSGDVSLKTVNGSVTAELPGSLNANVDLSTVNGRFVSDFPATVTGKIDPRHLRATIGTGGRQLKIETVNGSVSLKKSM